MLPGAAYPNLGRGAIRVCRIWTPCRCPPNSSRVARLHELATIVEGRAPVSQRSSRRPCTVDNVDESAELAEFSEEFAQMTDLIAAASAAIAYRRRGLRAAAFRCSARAEELAQRYGGAHTPALHRAIERLSLSMRTIEDTSTRP